MKYTRKFFDEFEWFHKPVSPIEESFMLPLQINESLELITKRTGLRFPKSSWKVISGYLYFSNEYWRLFLQSGFVSLLPNYLRDVKVAKDRWSNQVIPHYLSEIEKISKIDLTSFSLNDKLQILRRIAENEAKFFAESIYVIIYCLSTEIFLKLLYPIFVRNSKKEDYYELLLGFPDKGLEMDSVLWQVAQIKDEMKREKAKEDWINKYGHRIQDKDLISQTLGENKELINQYIKIYRKISDPSIKQKAAKEKRLRRVEFVMQNLRSIPFFAGLFLRVLSYAQEYAKIRNSRPFYYAGNKYMRRLLLDFAEQIGTLQNRNDIFFLHIEELENIAVNKMTNKEINDLIIRRKSLYKKLILKDPEFEVEEEK